MITVLLLVIIYFAFISLGLPDSILGVTIPAIQNEWGISLSTGGIISMTVMGCAIASSFASGYLIKKLGTGKIVFLSCFLTGSALLGFSFSNAFIWLIILAVPLGFGGGSVDAALNNYVALHYKARHMNWLHSFWGVGATLGPVIMSAALANMSWREGYRIISFIQLSLSIILFLSLPLWRRGKQKEPAKEASVSETGFGQDDNVFKCRGVIFTLMTVMLYCAVEASVGLWGSSFLVGARGFGIETAALIMAFYYGGITAGRFISGFASIKFTNSFLIRAGMIITFCGLIMLFIPLNKVFAAFSVVLTGLGLAPIYPAMLHETPTRFGNSVSQKIIGYQIGFAGLGSAVISPLIGLLLQNTEVIMMPVYAGFITIIMFITSELIVERDVATSVN